mmetsp:Transcript_53737/g.126603  ORF Transcript_53737/g.126603 Transcript_53737/m.126603 type:complete len:211 (-) Transcript_53737:730-1362(-)
MAELSGPATLLMQHALQPPESNRDLRKVEAVLLPQFTHPAGAGRQQVEEHLLLRRAGVQQGAHIAAGAVGVALDSEAGQGVDMLVGHRRCRQRPALPSWLRAVHQHQARNDFQFNNPGELQVLGAVGGHQVRRAERRPPVVPGQSRLAGSLDAPDVEHVGEGWWVRRARDFTLCRPSGGGRDVTRRLLALGQSVDHPSSHHGLLVGWFAA